MIERTAEQCENIAQVYKSITASPLYEVIASRGKIIATEQKAPVVAIPALPHKKRKRASR